MEETAGNHEYIIHSCGRAMVAAYTGLNFHEIGRLDYGTYLLWLRDAYIMQLNRTEEGRAYLEDCWRMTQEKPDRAKLRMYFGKGATNGK